MKIFDTHCHLNSKDFDADRESIIQRSSDAGVVGLALITADEQGLDENAQLEKHIQQQHPHMVVVRSAGIHPHDAKTISDACWNKVLTHAQTAAAIGETGLDYYYNHSDPVQQKLYFQKHIELAISLKKPLVVHCRDAAKDVLDLLTQDSLSQHPNPGVLHCFTESYDFAKTLLDRGYYISFSGVLTFKTAEKLREVAEKLPIDRLLVETDSPWLAPAPYRGKRNEPSFTKQVLECLSSIKKIDVLQLSEQIWNNSIRFYNVRDKL